MLAHADRGDYTSTLDNRHRQGLAFAPSPQRVAGIGVPNKVSGESRAASA